MGKTVTRQKIVLDIECYCNYFLIAVKNMANGNTATYELSDWSNFDHEKLKAVLSNYTIITFNGNRYDMLLLKYSLTGANNVQLKALSDAIIEGQAKPWDLERKHNLPECKYIDHIDLIEVAPGKCSLKTYGGRLHSERMQDLPIRPEQRITVEDRELLTLYCINDLDTTIDLYRQLEKQIDLRENMSIEFKSDLRSKSDAQIAEVVIRKQVEKLKNEKIQRPNLPIGYAFKYKAPAYIVYKTQNLKSVLNTFESANFTLNEKGDVAEPVEIGKLKVTLGTTVYQFGIGGIHSCEKKQATLADESHRVFDRDVTSYYPNIILNQKLSPDHLGNDFLKVYKSIVDRRIRAKRSKDSVVDAALKITINGSFGKLGSKWSVLYAPNLMAQVTITGQLALMMLVERLEGAGISVMSANTDGIVIRCHTSNQAAYLQIVASWETDTGFATEETEYLALYSRDINNYIAIKPNGSYKVKGTYADASLSKTPTGQICSRALIDFLQLDIPMETTINSCSDIKQFVHVRNVTGGAVKGNDYLGRAVRWYYAIGESGTINYAKNGNKVPRTDGAKPLMILPKNMPKDLDRSWYIAETKNMLKELYISS